MFLNFSQISNNKGKKEFIKYINEVYKHITILKNEINITDSNIKKNMQEVKEILFNFGVLSETCNIKDLTLFINENCDFSGIDFYEKIISIDHNYNEICILPLYCKKCRDLIKNKDAEIKKPTIVDLFCGAGGMSLGFKQSGFKIVFANDIEDACIDTYKFNHPEVNSESIILGDIQNIAAEIKKHLNNEVVDVVIGGPPCQGFSEANRQRLIDDPRNRLYREYVEVVDRLQPKFFVMENVTGMKNIATQIIEDFNNIGYEVKCEILNSVDFSVPQNRKRIIFIGNRLNINNSLIFEDILSSSKKNKEFNLKDAIEDLPNLQPLRIKNATGTESEESGSLISLYSENNKQNEYLRLVNQLEPLNFLYNHKSRFNNDRDIEIFSRLNQGDKSDDPKIADIMPYHSRKHIFKDKYFKLIYNQPCKTITAHMKFDCNMYIHPAQPRGLTPREAARVQSFPDNYFFRGPFTKTYMQIGNSVPPLMSRQIAQVIHKFINKTQNETNNSRQLSLKI